MSDKKMRKPRCHHGSVQCPGTSDKAYEWADEQCWDLQDWLCQTCTIEFKLELGLPITEDEIEADNRKAMQIFAEVCKSPLSAIF